MNFFTFALCVTFAIASAITQIFGYRYVSNRPFQNSQFNPNEGFRNQGFPNRGFQNTFTPNPNNPFLQNIRNPSVNAVGNQVNPSQGTLDQFITQRPNQNQRQTTRPPFPAAQPSQPPQFLRCNQNCLTTNEYNPVCGSNGVTYYNDRKLQCANQCGRRLNQKWQDIQIRRPGTCGNPLGS